MRYFECEVKGIYCSENLVLLIATIFVVINFFWPLFFEKNLSFLSCRSGFFFSWSKFIQPSVSHVQSCGIQSTAAMQKKTHGWPLNSFNFINYLLTLHAWESPKLLPVNFYVWVFCGDVCKKIFNNRLVFVIKKFIPQTWWFF